MFKSNEGISFVSNIFRFPFAEWIVVDGCKRVDLLEAGEKLHDVDRKVANRCVGTLRAENLYIEHK